MNFNHLKTIFYGGTDGISSVGGITIALASNDPYYIITGAIIGISALMRGINQPYYTDRGIKS